jgi:hypothetical protein
VTNQEIENTQRHDEISTSLFYPFTADPMSNQVPWLSNSIDGPYAGKLEQLTKCALQLENNSSSAFYMFYASLKAFITGCGFNEKLLPSLLLIAGDLDLTKTPIGLDMPNIGAKYGGVKMPLYYWQEQHNRLSAAIFALLAGRDVLSVSASKSIKNFDTLSFLSMWLPSPSASHPNAPSSFQQQPCTGLLANQSGVPSDEATSSS